MGGKVRIVLSDENGNSAHIAEHGLTLDEVESVLIDLATTFDISDSSGRPFAFGDDEFGSVYRDSVPSGTLEFAASQPLPSHMRT